MEKFDCFLTGLLYAIKKDASGGDVLLVLKVYADTGGAHRSAFAGLAGYFFATLKYSMPNKAAAELKKRGSKNRICYRTRICFLI